jgi:hypothetical protein
MAAWIGVFGLMYATGFVGRGHPGNETRFWEQACEGNLRNGCQTLFQRHRNNCSSGSAAACLAASDVLAAHPEVSGHIERMQLLSRGCDLGNAAACDRFRAQIEAGGRTLLTDACDGGDLSSCFIVGLVDMFGVGVPPDTASAIASWSRACDGNWARACGYLGEAYLLGRYVTEDAVVAGSYLDAACGLGYQPSCTTLGLMYIRGHGVDRDDRKGRRLLAIACDSGWQLGCSELEKLDGR